MNKIIIGIIGVIALSAAFAENAPAKKELTPAERSARAAARLQRVGGLVVIPGKGHVSVFNDQKAIDRAVIDGSVEKVRALARNISFEYKEVPFALATAKASRVKDSAAAAVYIVDDPALPMSLVSVEEGWGVVNVASLREGNPSAEKLKERFRREFTRVMGITFSGARSQFESSVLQPVKDVGDLDKLVCDELCMDSMVAILANLNELGVTPGEIVSYRAACQRGIAPQPTNDIQKAIWDAARELPQKPMQIKFDPKTDK